MKKKTLIVIALILLAAFAAPLIRGMIIGKNVETKKVVIVKGETTDILLEENLTTGYSWHYKISDNSVVVIEGDKYIEPNSSLMGASGSHSYTVKGVKTGKTEIRFEYYRNWEPENIQETIIYVIEVI